MFIYLLFVLSSLCKGFVFLGFIKYTDEDRVSFPREL